MSRRLRLATVSDLEPSRVTRVSAYAVCIDARRQILLCRIAPGWTVGFDGWWTLPGGGIEHGEDPRDAALRELTEETGLTGEVTELLDVDSWHTISAGTDGTPRDYHGIRVLYRVALTGGELRDEPDGSTDTCRWFGRDELGGQPLVDIVELAVRLALD
jgi:8-oxo-dGTP diphosphatase